MYDQLKYFAFDPAIIVWVSVPVLEVLIALTSSWIENEILDKHLNKVFMSTT